MSHLFTANDVNITAAACLLNNACSFFFVVVVVVVKNDCNYLLYKTRFGR